MTHDDVPDLLDQDHHKQHEQVAEEDRAVIEQLATDEAIQTHDAGDVDLPGGTYTRRHILTSLSTSSSSLPVLSPSSMLRPLEDDGEENDLLSHGFGTSLDEYGRGETSAAVSLSGSLGGHGRLTSFDDDKLSTAPVLGDLGTSVPDEPLRRAAGKLHRSTLSTSIPASTSISSFDHSKVDQLEETAVSSGIALPSDVVGLQEGKRSSFSRRKRVEHDEDDEDDDMVSQVAHTGASVFPYSSSALSLSELDHHGDANSAAADLGLKEVGQTDGGVGDDADTRHDEDDEDEDGEEVDEDRAYAVSEVMYGYDADRDHLVEELEHTDTRHRLIAPNSFGEADGSISLLLPLRQSAGSSETGAPALKSVATVLSESSLTNAFDDDYELQEKDDEAERHLTDTALKRDAGAADAAFNLHQEWDEHRYGPWEPHLEHMEDDTGAADV